MGQPYYNISAEARDALQEFVEDFRMALAQANVEQWAKDLGHSRSVNNPATKTTFPVPVFAALYSEFKGDMKYRSLYHTKVELLLKTWQDGVAELATTIEAPDFIGWVEQPAAMAAAAQALPNDVIAGLLEANPTCFDDLTFFNDAHPVNIFDVGMGTFDNDITGAGTNVTVANLGIAKKNFRKLKAPNGKPLGLRLTHILAPPAQEEAWKDILEQDMLIQATGSAFGSVDNRHKGTAKLIVADELTDDLKFYPLALEKPGMFPWVVQGPDSPETIILDKSSHLYQTALKLGLTSILHMNGALLMPQCVQRWAGTAP